MTHARTISPTGTPCPLCGGTVWTNGAVTMCGDCFQMPRQFPPSPAIPSTSDAGALAGGASRPAGLFHTSSACADVNASRADAAPGRVVHSLQGPTEARHNSSSADGTDTADAAPGPVNHPPANRVRHLFVNPTPGDWIGGLALFAALAGGLFAAWGMQ